MWVKVVSLAHNIQALENHETTSFDWPLATLLVAALTCALLSFSNEVTLRDFARVSVLQTTVSDLNSNSDRTVEGWVVEAHQLLPALDQITPELSDNLRAPLEKLTVDLSTTAYSQPVDQLRLRQVMFSLQSKLKAQEDSLISRLSTFGFGMQGILVLIAVLIFAILRRVRSKTTFAQYCADQFMFPNAPLAMALSDARDKTVRTNDAFDKVTGFTEDELRGRAVFDQEPEGMHSALSNSGVWIGEQRLRRKDGSELSEKVLRLALGESFEQPDGYLTMSMETVVSDDERRLMLWQAHHDNLTKLPNSNLLNERLSRGLTSVLDDKSGRVGALISIDIDHFREVNDSIGHELADRVLTDAAYRIAMCARESDTVARVGGDLFMIAMFDIEQVSDAEMIARQAIDAFQAPFILEEKEIFLTASAGLTIFPTDGMEKGELLQKADAARLQAKKLGGGQFAFFEESMNSAAARRLEIETHLRRAIAQDELELHYQPIIDLATGKVSSAEARLRWNSAELGFVSPGEFIPVAESSGMIVDVGAWVVRDVQRQLNVWGECTDWPDIRVSLNVSARQFSREEDADQLLSALQTCRKGQVTIELTESALVTDDPGASRFLQGIKEQGLRIALDDFGTGYSSIGYLRDFDFDVLKIDKSFIDGLENVKDYGLVASIVAMGRILGLKIVAEGVEDESQVHHLKQVGCDYIQGFFYSRPLPVAEFEEFVRNHR